jgi:cytochrome c oxidase subunit 6a
MNKWRTVTFLAIPACCAFGVYSFANAEHGHGEEQPQYSYLKRRSREQWPWGGDLGLFEYPKEDGGHH